MHVFLKKCAWASEIPPILERMQGDLEPKELKTIDNPPHDVLDGQGFISIGLDVEEQRLG